MQIKKRWFILTAFIAIISIIGIFIPEEQGLWDFVETEECTASNVAWMITATIFVLMMTPGLSFFYGGMVGKKNVISTILQSFIAMGIISILWVVVGFSLAFGNDVGGLGLIGDPTQYFMFQHVGAKPEPYLTSTIPLALYALFQMKFAIITPSLITGSFAERVRFSAYMVFMILFSLIIYCPLAHWTWHPDGLLHKWLDIHDFAGGIVVHASSGIAALAGAIFLGRRQSSNEHHLPANVPFVILGAGLLWLGWFGFNGGSGLAADGIAIKAFLNTNTAGATAMMTWIFIDCLRGRKPSGMGAAVGAVIGLVAITPCADVVTTSSSFIIAVITTLVCNIAVHWRENSSIDDALDVFPTHGVGGITATILTGVFSYTGLIHGGVGEFVNSIIGVVIVIAYTFVVSFALYWITNLMIPMRVSIKSERMGLDVSQHDESYAFSDSAEREIAEYFDNREEEDNRDF
ncbi:MAG: ammonium transporter [Paludibacteraceae bacterium]|nr:ammonium transporter [Paludibacteraceae bacterium]MBR4839087.1 ammonium transporter [Paludibacteraceae bacterium]